MPDHSADNQELPRLEKSEVHSLIDAYSQYTTFISTFDRLEKGELNENDGTVQPMWKVIAGLVGHDRDDVDSVILRAGKHLTPENLGQRLFRAKDKKNNAYVQQGIVQAFPMGSVLVMVVSSEDDLHSATDVRNQNPDSILEGVFSMSTYRLNKHSISEAVGQVPTVWFLIRVRRRQKKLYGMKKTTIVWVYINLFCYMNITERQVMQNINLLKYYNNLMTMGEVQGMEFYVPYENTHCIWNTKQ
jgi:hypothetical protein